LSTTSAVSDQAAASPKAALVYDQLGTLLEMFGWFEQHPEYEEAVKQLVKGAKKCH